MEPAESKDWIEKKDYVIPSTNTEVIVILVFVINLFAPKSA